MTFSHKTPNSNNSRLSFIKDPSPIMMISRRQMIKSLGVTMAASLTGQAIFASTGVSNSSNSLYAFVTANYDDSYAFRKAVMEHASQVLPTDVCMPVIRKIQSAPIYTAPPVNATTIHEQYKSRFVIDLTVQPTQTSDGLYYKLQQYVYVDEVSPRWFKDINMLELLTFTMPSVVRHFEGVLSPCNERMAYKDDYLIDHLNDTARQHGLNARDLRPLYCRPVRLPRSKRRGLSQEKSTFAHAVEARGERDARGNPKLSLLIPPDAI